MDVGQQYITYGMDRIHFELQTKKNDNHRITIKVKPDCHVIVLAPPSATTDEIIVAVNKRARWVHRKLQEFKVQQDQTLSHQYISGESHYYLGRRYLLKVIDDPKATPNVKLVCGRLQVMAPQEKIKVQSLLFAWYEQKASEVFNRRLDALLSEAHWINHRPSLTLRTMQARWGSCSPNGRIVLNTHLIKAPMECIDYVILHELCHIAEHNHSHNFYRLLNQVRPNWEKTKNYLDQKASIYISV